MTNTRKIQIKRGTKSTLPTLSIGEPAFTTDTDDLYIGSSTGNIQFAKKQYVDDSINNKTSVSGNAGTATKLQTARTITITGDVTGSTSFDGSANVSIASVVTDDSHNHTTSTITNFASGVINSVLTGLSTATSTALVVTDSILIALGKLQGQNNNNVSALSNHASNTSNPHGTTAAQVGLGNVTNESKLTMFNNAALTGIPTAPTAANGTNTIQIATTQFVTSAINTAVSGSTASANKLTTARTITLTGDVTGSTSFDGSANVSIAAVIADDSHNHTIANIDNLQSTLDTKAPLDSPVLTGVPTAPTAAVGTSTVQLATTAFVNGTLSGMTSNLNFANSGLNFRGISGMMADNDSWRIGGAGTASDVGYLEIATADNGNEPIYVKQYNGMYTTLLRTATLLDANGNTNFPGIVTAASFNGVLDGGDF